MVTRRDPGEGVIVLALTGMFIGGAETEELEAALRGLSASANDRLILDLSGCGMMNSIGIGALIEGRKSYGARGGEIKLCALGPRLTSIFTATKMNLLFEMCRTEAEAIASFGARPV